ncbi:MAG: 4'-phosphopantetheinyl transferase superfamily protein [Xanthomonadaceae bacterium]|nr:4'-phosphopantetheinyl transferase superfamily protein [Xanthomonadaceae bacterium]MDE1884641.1 4'-phosphopantetheinyl transferase superfamily protein [Xanthomonadaceae bacterium]MDE1960387.1 4'-phosphopantetheinyl transferase superfamily protein [Xanthomonadaceae bacterium]MDE2083519.1 4'-phosphopantetheinyl transferase superfamily protein [Xanthomonadaceae bacterium]MDE2257549.1 4'-phosphopantetheinyl transferase superfamily protein [Xanthomonadaceae bacterium]
MSVSTLNATDFIPADAPSPLPDGEIHLWFFPQWENVPDAATSAPVRALLAAYLDRPPASICIDRGEHGKPRVTTTRLEFSLAHAADALLLGISRDLPLGVDLESAQRRIRSACGLARRFFDPDEAAVLENLPDALRQAVFLRLWCAKEAALKAHGQGIGFGLDRVGFAIDPSGAIAPAVGNPWRILGLAPSPAYLGALAWSGSVSRVRAFVARN